MQHQLFCYVTAARFILFYFYQFITDSRWMSMAKVWAEDGERESLSTSLLSLHNGVWLSSSETSIQSQLSMKI